MLEPRLYLGLDLIERGVLSCKSFWTFYFGSHGMLPCILVLFCCVAGYSTSDGVHVLFVLHSDILFRYTFLYESRPYLVESWVVFIFLRISNVCD